jgi:hypothetical protein
MSNFKLDKAGLKRAVEKGVRENVLPLMQRAVDDVFAFHHGEPVDDVKAVLRRRWHEIGDDWDLTDPHLTAWSEAISNGQKIVVELGAMR